MQPIGYYVHHHGAGHVQRFRKIRSRCEVELVGISGIAGWDGLELPSDIPDEPGDPTADGSLHWAPIGSQCLARRAHIVGDWIVSRRPRGIVVDVSIEMALLCRLYGVATVVVRQHGCRTDPAHELAYRTARRLLAPFPAALEHPGTPAWIADKTDYSGFVMTDRDRSSTQPSLRPGAQDVVILWGSGGGQLPVADLVELTRVVSPHRVWCIGEVEAAADLDRDVVVDCGWIDDVGGLLINRPVVVASAGNNAVADVARAGAPLVVVPQPRPFDEQVRHAQSLGAAKAAAIVTNGADAATWAEALETARDRRKVLSSFARQDGAVAAAHFITEALPPTSR